MAMAIGIHKKPIQRPIKLETPLEYMTEKTLKMLLYKLSITDAAHTKIFVSHQSQAQSLFFFLQDIGTYQADFHLSG